jgi:hypothetical protein
MKKKKEITFRQIPYIFELKPKGGAQNNSEERKPAQTITNVFWECVERLLDEWNPDRFNRTRDY